jgi:hypothetical protein
MDQVQPFRVYGMTYLPDTGGFDVQQLTGEKAQNVNLKSKLLVAVKNGDTINNKAMTLPLIRLIADDNVRPLLIDCKVCVTAPVCVICDTCKYIYFEYYTPHCMFFVNTEETTRTQLWCSITGLVGRRCKVLFGGSSFDTGVKQYLG